MGLKVALVGFNISEISLGPSLLSKIRKLAAYWSKSQF